MTSAAATPQTAPAELYARVFRLLRPRTPLPEVHVEFRHFANANSFIQLKNGRLEVRIADIFATAPVEIQEALAWILLSKLYRKVTPRAQLYRYKRYVNRKDITRALEQNRRE